LDEDRNDVHGSMILEEELKLGHRRSMRHHHAPWHWADEGESHLDDFAIHWKHPRRTRSMKEYKSKDHMETVCMGKIPLGEHRKKSTEPQRTAAADHNYRSTHHSSRFDSQRHIPCTRSYIGRIPGRAVAIPQNYRSILHLLGVGLRCHFPCTHSHIGSHKNVLCSEDLGC
jgi:hypothetical protein